jgi:glycosyltransferase involved in cell wall biosynthesis
MKRLLTIGHSYVVAANRELAHQMALQGHGAWQVTAVAPAHYRGDLRPIATEPIANEASALETLPVRLDRAPHLMWFGGRLREILAHDWDVVHCWEEPYTFAASRIASHVPARAAFVVASFQNISKAYPWPISAFERKTMARTNAWIAFGETVRETLASRDGYTRPSRVIPPGVDLHRFRPDPAARQATRARLGWPGDAVVVGYLGRFVEEKGLDLLTHVLGGVLHDPTCRALFVGGGDLERRLRQFAEVCPGRVQVHTGVPHDDVPAWLNAMDILCAPSRSTPRWREQFGRMLIEAMACGVAVIASDSGEMPFVVGDAGVIVGEDDEAGWRHAVERLVVDEAARRMYAQRGLARAQARFTWPIAARQHLEFFDALTDGRERP